MEFLVRLIDKTNTSVHCLNPAHTGIKTIYDDPTFVAPCPFCGSFFHLVRKQNVCTKKGHFITYKPDGWNWGHNELKHYGIVRIDCTDAEAKEFCKSAGMDASVFRIEHEKLLLTVDMAQTVQARDELTALETNRSVLYRPRKYRFDFEAILTASELKNWNNKNVNSKIIQLENSDKTHIHQD